MSGESKRSSLTAPFTGQVLRVWWMLVGNGVLAVLAAMLVLTENDPPSALDASFAATVASLLAARHLDVHRYAGRTPEGEPATPRDFRRYALKLLAVASVAWGGATALAL